MLQTVVFVYNAIASGVEAFAAAGENNTKPAASEVSQQYFFIKI
jgi:hypothetical protein